MQRVTIPQPSGCKPGALPVELHMDVKGSAKQYTIGPHEAASYLRVGFGRHGGSRTHNCTVFETVAYARFRHAPKLVGCGGLEPPLVSLRGRGATLTLATEIWRKVEESNLVTLTGGYRLASGHVTGLSTFRLMLLQTPNRPRSPLGILFDFIINHHNCPDFIWPLTVVFEVHSLALLKISTIQPANSFQVIAGLQFVLSVHNMAVDG
jgi:hypothetical protein